MFFSTLSLSCALDHHAKNGFVRTYRFSTSSMLSTSGTPSVSGKSNVMAQEQSALQSGHTYSSLNPLLNEQSINNAHMIPISSKGKASLVTSGR